MRKKQTGPELKTLELDTLKYITPDNVKDSVYYIGIFPERMSPADVTFARKSGLLETSDNTLHLSKVALHVTLGAISYREYAFLMLSKQWIKTTNVKDEPTDVYQYGIVAIVPKLINISETDGNVGKYIYLPDVYYSGEFRNYSSIVLIASVSLLF